MAVSVLLYRCTTWTLTKSMENKFHRNYTRILQATLNMYCRQYSKKQKLYGHLPLITKAIQVRRTRLSGYCLISRDELIMGVFPWTPSHQRAKGGRPARTNIQQLLADIGCSPEDLPEAMDGREGWRERARDISADGASWWWWWCPNSSALEEKKINTWNSGSILCSKTDLSCIWNA